MLGDFISVDRLACLIGSDHAPVIIDVRRAPVFDDAPVVLPAARRHMHTTLNAAEIGPAPNGIVVYCAHGHNVSQLGAALLRAEGADAAPLSGGIEAWIAAGYPVAAREPDAAGRFGAGTTWVTRRRPKIDRVACPWFIRRFIDDRARFLFVEPDQVLAVAAESGGIAFDVEGAPVTHDGAHCSFDALLRRYHITDPALLALADIVRGADTGVLDGTREAGGLLAISLGLAALEHDDHVILARGFHLYDGLYASLRLAAGEQHSWPAKT